jgi:hypothetical protein
LGEQAIIALAFALHKTVDELECADEFWIMRMMLDQEARAIAGAPTDVDYRRRVASIVARMKS